MNRLGRAAVILAIGVILGRLLWSGGFGWFVQQRMRWPLLGATVVLLVFAIYEALAGTRAEQVDPATSRRRVGPMVGWLLILPIMVLTSVAPTGLGAAAADRVEAFTPTEATSGFEPLDDSGAVIPMRVFDFLDRAVWDKGRSLEGVPVLLDGLVVNEAGRTDGFLLTKFLVSCCAADGIPIQVAVEWDRPIPDDTWVSAELVWIPPQVPFQDTPTPWLVEARATSVTIVPDPPNDPYESPY